MELTYNIHDKPPVKKIILSALQQLLAVIAGTISMPIIVGHGMSQSAALLGAGIGTIVYLLITRFKSPVFLGSSFSFVGSLTAAFAGAASASIGYLGIILGALLGGLVYVILSIIVKYAGTKWIDKIAPPVIIGPTVAIIGLTLAPNAISNLLKGSVYNADGVAVASPYIALLCGLVTLFTSIAVSVYAKKTMRLIPFIIGILSGYALASLFTIIGNTCNVDALKVIDFSAFKSIKWIPEFSFVKAIQGIKDFESVGQFFSYFGLIAIAYVPVSFVCFTEHIADHKNLSFITGQNLLEDPGLSKTLCGDGTGSFVGAFFGGCPNTTYGESISCTALSRNASTITILAAAVMAIVISFVGPLMTFCQTIPTCIIGGLSIALYGFIASSGFQMLNKVDMSDHKNIFVVSAILITGVGGLAIQFYQFSFSPVACALVLGIIVNLLVNVKPRKQKTETPKTTEEKNRL